MRTAPVRQSFWDNVTVLSEIGKYAEVAKVEQARKELAAQDVESFQKKLRVGDLLFTAPKKDLEGSLLVRYVYKPLSRAIQGTNFGHAALYVGRGFLVDADFTHGVRKASLKSVAERHNILAARVTDATVQEIREATDYLKKQLGKGYDTLGLLRAGTPLQGQAKASPEVVDRFICSGLVANAFRKRRFAETARQYTRPSQLLASGQVVPVAILEQTGERKHDSTAKHR